MLRRPQFVVASYELRRKDPSIVSKLLCSAVIAIGMTGVSFVAPIPASAAQVAPADAAQVAPGAHEAVKVYAPPSLVQPFDMKQCYEDGRGCQLATCASTLTQDGNIIICQSHGTFFP